MYQIVACGVLIYFRVSGVVCQYLNLSYLYDSQSLQLRFRIHVAQLHSSIFKTSLALAIIDHEQNDGISEILHYKPRSLSNCDS